MEKIFHPQATARGVNLQWSIDQAIEAPYTQDSIDGLLDGSSMLIDTKQYALPKLIGDKRRLLQVLINLVKNALKFTQDGTIRLKVRYDGQRKHLIVHV